MNSLQELNTFGQTSLDLPDERGSQVIFDRVAPLQPLDTTDQIVSTTVAVNPGIEIVEIVNHATANVRYRVRIQTSGSPALTGSTVNWASIPSGLTLTTVGNTYTISGITTLAHWNAIKSFTWNLPANYASCPNWFLDVAVLYYDSARNEEMVVDWEVYDPDNYYIAKINSSSSLELTILKIKSSSASNSATASLIAQGSYARFADAALTASASISAVGTTNPTNLNATFSLACSFRYNVRPTLAFNSQSNMIAYNTTYIDVTRSADTYTLNTATAITGGPLITDALQDGSGNYTMTVYPIPSTAVSTMSSSGRWIVNNQQNLSSFENTSDISWAIRAMSNDGDYILATWTNSYAPGNGTTGYGVLYQKINGQYSYWTNFSPLVLRFNRIVSEGYSNNSISLGDAAAINNGAGWIAMMSILESATEQCYIYIWQRDTTTFAQRARIAFSARKGNAGNQLSFSNDGLVLAASCSGTFSASTDREAFVKIYRRSGTTWSLESTIQPAEVLTGIDGAGAGFFGSAISMSGDGTRIAIGAGYQGNITSFSPLTVADTKWGAVYIYKYSAGSWTQETRIVPGDSTTNNYFGLGSVRLNSDGSRLLAKSATGIYVYTRSGTTWTLLEKVSTYYGDDLGSVSNSMYGTDYVKNYTYKTANYGILTNVGTTWNAAAKTLTMSGTRAQVNADIDTIQLTPTTGYTGNFDLRYTVLTPRNRTDSRDQDINYTP